MHECFDWEKMPNLVLYDNNIIHVYVPFFFIVPPQSFKEDESLVVTSCPPLMAPPLPPLPPPPPPPPTTKQLTLTVSPIEMDKQVSHT
jgi:hypothetical protein